MTTTVLRTGKNVRYPRALVESEQVHRLVRTLKRGSPDARVLIGHDFSGCDLDLSPLSDLSGVDLWAPMASRLRGYRRSVGDFPAAPRNIAADPERVAHWRAQLAALPGRKVGILWKRNISKDARHRYFSPFAA